MKILSNPTADNAEVAAAQLAADIIEVNASKSKVLYGQTVLTGSETGTLALTLRPQGSIARISLAGLAGPVELDLGTATDAVIDLGGSVSMPSLTVSNGNGVSYLCSGCSLLSSAVLLPAAGLTELTLAGWAGSTAAVDAVLAECVSAGVGSATINLTTPAGTSVPSVVPDVAVAGTLSPDVTAFTWAFDGVLNGAPKWKAVEAFGVGVDGYLAYSGGGNWYISDEAGGVGASGYWTHDGAVTEWAGEYAPDGVIATGTATVSGGTGATTKGEYYVTVLVAAGATVTVDA